MLEINTPISLKKRGKKKKKKKKLALGFVIPYSKPLTGARE